MRIPRALGQNKPAGMANDPASQSRGTVWKRTVLSALRWVCLKGRLSVFACVGKKKDRFVWPLTIQRFSMEDNAPGYIHTGIWFCRGSPPWSCVKPNTVNAFMKGFLLGYCKNVKKAVLSSFETTRIAVSYPYTGKLHKTIPDSKLPKSILIGGLLHPGTIYI